MTSGQGILSLAIKEKSSLYAAFIPFVTNGGLFIPTNRAYKLGDEVFMLLNLMDEPERVPVAGKIIWITPRGTGGSRTPGVGVQFSEQDRGDTRNRIENLLGILLQSDKSTYTM